MNQFNLNDQYKVYLERVALKEEAMHPTQRKQLKEAFYGACGQLLIVFRDELTVIDEDKAVEEIQNMINQVGDYFLSIKGESN